MENNENINSYLNQGVEAPKRLKIAIIGQSGSGKSSMINAIFGEKKAQIRSINSPSEIKSYAYNQVDFYDLPGHGTSDFPQATYIKDCDLLSFDVFIMVTANRFYENDLHLMSEMLKAGRPVYVVCSKMDQAVINEKRDNNLAAAEVYDKVRADLKENLKTFKWEDVYLISSVEGIKDDFKRLLNIISSLDKTKEWSLADKILCQRKILDRKNQLACGFILNQISEISKLWEPKLFSESDFSLLIRISKAVIDIFNLDEELLNYENKNNPEILAAARAFSEKFTTKEGLHLLFENHRKKRTIWDIIPTTTAMPIPIGMRMAHHYRQDLLKEAYALAIDILAISAREVSDYFAQQICPKMTQ